MTIKPIKEQPFVDGPWTFGGILGLPQVVRNIRTVFYQTVVNREQLTDAMLRAASGIPGIVYSSLSLARLALSDVPFFHQMAHNPILRFLSPSIAIVGLAVSTIEATFNLIQLRRSGGTLHRIISKASENLVEQDPNKTPVIAELYDNPEQAAKIGFLASKLSLLQDKYYKKDATEDERLCAKNKLSNRLQPWCEERIGEQLESILDKLNSEVENFITPLQQEGIEEAEDLLDAVKTQLEKAQILHSLSLMALIICSLGFLLTSIGAFSLIAPHLIYVGTLAVFLISLYGESTLSEEKWKINKEYYIPNLVKKYLLGQDLKAENKLIEKVKNSTDYITAKEAALQIKNPYARARALFCVLELELNGKNREEEIKQIYTTMETLSTFYRNKAKRAIEEKKLTPKKN